MTLDAHLDTDHDVSLCVWSDDPWPKDSIGTNIFTVLRINPLALQGPHFLMTITKGHLQSNCDL